MLPTLTNESEILIWGEDSLKKEILARAAKELRDGGIIVGPTETRYGLLVRADSPECMRKLFALKGRDKSYPTAIFVRSIEEMKEIAIVNETAFRLAREFLPGPLTIVL
ncbi:MAG: Sua5/YciO/YrdC/YwlC family protein, partial [candidate division Zixibacteria bacterium]|nr:Sua5/YciO/YrdC/YwlC family protein [candidate division Zixibacteria bacterium]